jgi:hypothetical protein
LDVALGGFGRGLERKSLEKKVQGSSNVPFLNQKAGTDPADKGGLRCREYERLG